MLLSLEDLINKYDLKITGIIHCGASLAQENGDYKNCGIEDVVWIEAIPHVFQRMRRKLLSSPQAIAIKECIGEEDNKEVDFFVSSNDAQSSSLLELKEHLQYYPNVKFVDNLRLKTKRMDTIIDEYGIDMSRFNFLNIDLQGAELMALKSMGKYMNYIQCAYVEVNQIHLYKDCPLVGDIDAFMEEWGLYPVETRWSRAQWGERLYMKTEPKEQAGIAYVPGKFQVRDTHFYPPDNNNPFEEWFYKNVKPEEITGDRLYLPIFFTGYFKKYDFGKDKAGLDQLQVFVDSLDRSKKYFTICQFDDGTMVDWKDLDIRVFSMCGEPVHYPLPLLCMPHNQSTATTKDIFCSFVGKVTHPIRRQMINALQGKEGYYISTRLHPLRGYCDILARSVFALCPRGYGISSFRILESMQQGAIPIYCSDTYIIPHDVPFEQYGVLIDEADIPLIDEILRSFTPDQIAHKQMRLKEVYNEYYTFEANKHLILKNINS